MALSSCTSVLGIDGDYDDRTGPDGSAGQGNSGGSDGGGSGGTGATSGTGGASGAGGGAVDSGADAPPLGEQCLNGTDDDGDNFVDCADPDCVSSGHQCAPNPPAGWTGPFAYYDGPSAPACPGTFPTEFAAGGIGFNAVAASCSSCGCSTSFCKPVITHHADAACTQPQPQYKTSFSSGTCNHVEYNGTISSLNWVKTEATCNPSGGAATKPPATWTSERKLCEAQSSGAGCGASSMCLPAPGGSFNPRVCVAKAGTQTCPTPYTVSYSMLSKVTDTRACTKCSCGPAPCTVTLDVALGAASCFGSGNLSPGCNPTSPINKVGVSWDDTPPKPSCLKSGGVPTGDATASDPLAICCLP